MVLKQAAKRILTLFGLAVVRDSDLRVLNSGHTDIQRLFSKIAELKSVKENLKSQLHQDLFVLMETDFKRNGFFVEFGAADGLKNSNTYLLETEFDWSGILAEPGRGWIKQLKENRSARIDNRCVWIETGKNLKFTEANDKEFSTLSQYSTIASKGTRSNARIEYDVETVTLNDLLSAHNAPYDIDYISIDTEGSELEILKNFNFSRYNVSIFSIEHNFSPARRDVYELLKSNGYDRRLVYSSRWDDWYVKLK